MRTLLTHGILIASLLGISTGAILADTSELTPLGSYDDFQSEIVIGGEGAEIAQVRDFSVSAGYVRNRTPQGVEHGVAALPASSDPIVFSGLQATEAGVIFGNDQKAGIAPGNTASFKVTLTAYAQGQMIGRVNIIANGNDSADQFIGFRSARPFDKVVLDYGPGATGTGRFITSARFGMDGAEAEPIV